MANISYFEAWGIWLDGKSTLGNTLFGIRMIWRARVGKITAFLSGMVVVLDLIGPDRLRRFGHHASKVDAEGSRFVFCLISGVAIYAMFAAFLIPAIQEWGIFPGNRGSVAVIAGAPGCLLALLALVGGFKPLVQGFASLLEPPRFEPMVRWLSVAGVLLGFHLDLLAS
ncbi:hypothetical protein [Nonomuraea dietziae]|uniref:hypothetical protein n=1 Tax=Nonomuraea dietziae TaxID=65515 RepID=UPI0034383480